MQATSPALTISSRAFGSILDECVSTNLTLDTQKSFDPSSFIWMSSSPLSLISSSPVPSPVMHTTLWSSSPSPLLLTSLQQHGS
ncbi:hypothetical protein GW17_00005037 [Ensete ventricosum]|nr:hypothetical protein GW17_00005037 [Ensete ventricosum]